MWIESQVICIVVLIEINPCWSQLVLFFTIIEILFENMRKK